ncbi:MAG TPA: radical SAM protein, partial [Polyangiaceae bacterium]|nr:radical SAM protein [Polyangiaceae bacterium]
MVVSSGEGSARKPRGRSAMPGNLIARAGCCRLRAAQTTILSSAMTTRRLPIANQISGGAAGSVGERHHLTKGLVRVTMACNERCPFCNVPVEDYPDSTPSDQALGAQLEAFLASGEQTLTLSGGEPTLRRGPLLDVIARARARGVPFVELQTNAILIDEPYARELAEAGLTSAFVSLLSDDAPLHDELAGLEGAFPLCLRG